MERRRFIRNLAGLFIATQLPIELEWKRRFFPGVEFSDRRLTRIWLLDGRLAAAGQYIDWPLHEPMTFAIEQTGTLSHLEIVGEKEFASFRFPVTSGGTILMGR
jgi:hypothetical protein